MKLFGRKPARYVLGLKQLPAFLAASWRACFVFERPLTVLWAYIARRSPPGGEILLRKGGVIRLSSDPADVVTVFIIFARKDYGKVEPGSTVIDVGANIGVFALYAALSGAKAVYAFEPSASSYETLLANIKVNGLESVIHAERRAVVGRPRTAVKFPRGSDVMNAIIPDSQEGEDYDLVPAVALSEIVASGDSFSLLKSDCEGGEYDIFLQASEADILKILEIRMEYHGGPRDELIARLKGFGYKVRQFMIEDAGGGYIWLAKNSPR